MLTHKNLEWIFLQHTVCPRSSDPFYIVTYYIKWVTASWAYSCYKSVCFEHVNAAPGPSLKKFREKIIIFLYLGTI